jgi:hypothetical protein
VSYESKIGNEIERMNPKIGTITVNFRVDTQLSFELLLWGWRTMLFQDSTVIMIMDCANA